MRCEKKQPLVYSHIESISNAVIGAAIGQGVLWLFDIPIVEAVWLNIIMIAVSYLRAFILRRIFAGL